ncbi:MAG: cysteine desulfurase family protein [Eubacteriales bacterium]|nr:cysteine desulfurase family protein [Eubacteriales bacterium]
MEHYLDNAATTKTCPEAIEAAVSVMNNIYGNPSSTHTKGREAKKYLAECRKDVSLALGAKPEEIVFTSCGSESDNWALISGAELMKRKGKHIISSMAEHDAIRKTLDKLESSGFEVTRLKPDSFGGIAPEAVQEALREDTVLVSLMMVNNETGAVTDIKAVSDLLKKSGSHALLHTDAVQGFMKVSFKASSLGADMISISGHKIHAVKGIGALYIRNGLNLKPFICGGEQESGRRAGTEALPQIAAFAAACRLDPRIDYMQSVKEALISRLTASIPELQYLETAAPHILSISMPGWRSEVLMNYLEAKNIYVSKSSACKQGKRSHVLDAAGLKSEVIDGALRIGISRYTTDEDISALTEGLCECRKLSHREVKG